MIEHLMMDQWIVGTAYFPTNPVEILRIGCPLCKSGGRSYDDWKYEDTESNPHIFWDRWLQRSIQIHHSDLVVWNMNGLFFHSVGNVIIPTDFNELIFFRGVGWNHQPGNPFSILSEWLQAWRWSGHKLQGLQQGNTDHLTGRLQRPHCNLEWWLGLGELSQNSLRVHLILGQWLLIVDPNMMDNLPFIDLDDPLG